MTREDLDFIGSMNMCGEISNEAYKKIACHFEEQEQKPGWIPVSERLPENRTYVLTTIHVPGRQPHARSGWYENGLFMNDNGDVWKSSDIEVKAWMPLPNPYVPDTNVGKMESEG